MNKVTDQQQQAAVQLIRVIADAIRDLGEVPSGHLYARVMEHMDLNTYNAIVGILKRARLVKERNYLLTWTGPKS